MAGNPKDANNGQYGLVSDTATDPIPAFPAAAAEGDGVPPLVDPFGREVVVIAGGIPPPPFMTRAQIGNGFNGTSGFRQLFLGAGIVQSAALSLELVGASHFSETTMGVYAQIHDSAGSPLGGGAGLVSVPLLVNRQPLFLDDGYEVVNGAVLVISNNVTSFFPLTGFDLGFFISSAVVFT